MVNQGPAGWNNNLRRWDSMTPAEQNEQMAYSLPDSSDMSSINPMWSRYMRVAGARGVTGFGGEASAAANRNAGPAPSTSRPASLQALSSNGIPWDDAKTIEGNLEIRRQYTNQQASDARYNESADRRMESLDALGELGSGHVGAATRMADEVGAEHQRAAGRSASETYFDPEVSRMREDIDQGELDKLRQRYADPAIVKAQAEIEAARVRGMYGLQRQDLTNQGNIDVQGQRGASAQATADTRARGGVGAAVAGQGGDPRPYLNGISDVDPSKTITQQELAAYAHANGMPIEDAAGVARQNGYTVR